MDPSTNIILQSNTVLLKILAEALKIPFVGFKSRPLQSMTKILYVQAAVYFLSYCREVEAPYIKYIFEAEQISSRRLAYPDLSKPIGRRLKPGVGEEQLTDLIFIIDRLIMMNKSFVHGNHIYFKIEQELGVFFKHRSRPVEEAHLGERNFYLRLWVRTIFIIRQFQDSVIILQVYDKYIHEAVKNGNLLRARNIQMGSSG